MSEGKDLFVRVSRENPLWKFETLEALQPVLTAADLFRRDRLFFSAGFCMSTAVVGRWTDREVTRGYIAAGLSDLKTCIENEPPDSPESLAALSQWRYLFGYVNPGVAAHSDTLLAQEIAQRLVSCFGASEHSDSYLARGIILSTDLEGHWETIFPENEVTGGATTLNYDKWLFQIESAFRLRLGAGDYVGAHAIAQRCPSAFTTFGLQGWALALEGLLKPTESVEFFTRAADVFAQDVEPSNDELQRRGHWDSRNIALWAKYFGARALVACIARVPTRSIQLLREASEKLRGTESGWVDPQVNRFRLLVNALLELMEGGTIDLKGFRHSLEWDQSCFGESSHDPLIEKFANLAAGAFEGFRKNPGLELTEGRLHIALDILGRLPLIGQHVATAITPLIGEKALVELFTLQTTWIYRTLEKLSSENQLQRIILRLEQAHLPRFAQVRHGPLEYGKDVVAVIEKDGRTILRMWQAKLGDINMSIWRTARSELEEMYLVPLNSLQIPVAVEERQGIFLCTGHANVNVEPVMEGWIAEQRKIGHQFEFMHLDGLVKWIIDSKLINEFRSALAELNLEPSV